MSDVSTLSRADVRKAFHQLLTNSLSGIPKENILPSRLADPKGMSPLIYVTSSGSFRPALTVRFKQNEFIIEVFVLVLLSDPSNPNWKEYMAEDMLDSVEAQMQTLLENNPSFSGLWTSVEYAQATTVERVPLSGHDYVVEVIQLKFMRG